MNNIRYANLVALNRTKASSEGVVVSHQNLYLFQGMRTVTVLTEEGFAGYRKLKEEWMKLSLIDVRRAVFHALKEFELQNTSRLEPCEEEFRRKI